MIKKQAIIDSLFFNIKFKYKVKNKKRHPLGYLFLVPVIGVEVRDFAPLALRAA